MSESKVKVSIIGAGGKMGTRVRRNLLNHTDRLELYLVENNPKSVELMQREGLEAAALDESVKKSDVIVLAVPDRLIKEVSQAVVPGMKAGAALIILDPASAVAGELAMKDGCTFAVTHPCHPSYFLDQDTPEARSDYFGGMGGRQDIVMALIKGHADRFETAVTISKMMFEPVENCYVMGLRDIAFLEPTLVELLGATCLKAMAETVDEAERRGIPREAAASFLTGHIYNLSANFLGYLGNTKVSDACQKAMELGKCYVLRDDWKKIWDDEILENTIDTMLHS